MYNYSNASVAISLHKPILYFLFKKFVVKVSIKAFHDITNKDELVEFGVFKNNELLHSLELEASKKERFKKTFEVEMKEGDKISLNLKSRIVHGRVIKIASKSWILKSGVLSSG